MKCPRCGNEMRLQKARLLGMQRVRNASMEVYRQYTLEVAIWVEATNYDKAYDEGADVFVCASCPDTYLAMRNEQVFSFVFPHRLGKYGGHVKAFADRCEVRISSEDGRNARYLHLPAVPWDISEERLQTLLTFL
jgi:hypothetical protein